MLHKMSVPKLHHPRIDTLVTKNSKTLIICTYCLVATTVPRSLNFDRIWNYLYLYHHTKFEIHKQLISLFFVSVFTYPHQR